MYYKIKNKNSEIYKKLHKMRSEELQMQKDNEKAISEKTGLTWTGFLGNGGQQNFRRVPMYSGFKFTEPEKVDLKVWKQHPKHDGVFVPYTRTKAGREMERFIMNGLKGSTFYAVYEILELDPHGKAVFPYVEIAGNVIVFFVDNKFEFSNPDIIEITKTEFNELLKD